MIWYLVLFMKKNNSSQYFRYKIWKYFEIIYLCRILTDNLSEEERINVMKDLFKIARAYKIYDPYEAKYLKIIARSLFISDKIFLKLKSNSI